MQLKKQLDLFGFPLCIYSYENHDKYKDEIIEQAGIGVTPSPPHSKISNSVITHYCAGRNGIGFLDRKNEALQDLRRSFGECLDHFYHTVLDANLYGQGFQISQSWTVAVTRRANGANGVNPHHHLLSWVCGAYYPKFKKGMSGALEVAIPRDPNHFFYWLDCYNLPQSKLIEPEEGDILLWTGNFNHQVHHSKDPDSRLSVIINSMPRRLCASGGDYSYNLDPALLTLREKWNHSRAVFSPFNPAEADDPRVDYGEGHPRETVTNSEE
jgi:hypothetical protein